MRSQGSVRVALCSLPLLLVACGGSNRSPVGTADYGSDAAGGVLLEGGGSDGAVSPPSRDAGVNAFTDGSQTDRDAARSVPDAARGDAAGARDAADGSIPRDRYVDPVNGSDTNDGLSPTTPYKTLYFAFAQMLLGAGTLWLLDGDYGPATGQDPPNGETELLVPGNISVRALHPGTVTLETARLLFEDSGELADVTFVGVRGAVGTLSGSVMLSRIAFASLDAGCADGALIAVGGTSDVTLVPGQASDDAAAAMHVQRLAYISNSGHLTIVGGTLERAEPSSCYPGAALSVVDGGRLTLSGVTLKDGATEHGEALISAGSGTPVVELTDTTLDGSDAMGTTTTAIVVDGDTTLRLVRSTIENFSGASAIYVQRSASDPAVPNVSLQDSFLRRNGWGIYSDGTNGGPVGLTITNTEFVANESAAILLENGGTVTMTGGKVQGNATLTGPTVGMGGLEFLNRTEHYSVKLRSLSITGNAALISNVPAVGMAGDATSSFDFGKVGDPGGNDFSGNPGGGLFVVVYPGVTVYAVGNTWNAGVQQADSQGHYGAVGPGASLDVQTGSGTNYSMAFGTLRLAENP